MARPMIEVYSVEIFPKSLPCQVYGDIYIYNDGDDESDDDESEETYERDYEQPEVIFNNGDESDNDDESDDDDSKETYTLYERDYEQPEVIFKDGQLLLLPSPDFPMSLPKPVITVQLWDRNEASDRPFEVSCTGHLDISIHECYDQDKSCVFEGEHGYVRVNYIAMTFGVVAELSLCVVLSNPGFVEMLKEPSRLQVSDKDFPVYGTIVARYGNTYGRTTCDSSVRYFDLLNIPSDEAIPLCFTDDIERADLLLTRRLVAVPAYSTLEFDVDLKKCDTDEQFLLGRVIHSAGKFCSCMHSHRGPPDIFSLNASLDLTWLDPSVDFEPLYSTLTVDKLASMSLDQKEKLLGWSDKETLLEVYSVFIGRDNHQDLSISGEIIVLHSNNHLPLCLFKRDEKNALELVNGEEFLSVTRPSSRFEFMMADYSFYLEMKLKDANDHFRIKEGDIDYDAGKLERHKRKQDKLLCSVIEGVGGFCAVHYTVFSAAVGVQVKCFALCKNILDVASVYGKIVASYDMFDYKFKDDIKYYGRVLFENDKDNAAFSRKLSSKEAEESSTDHNKLRRVEFSTSYIAMPIGGYTLLLNMDLHVITSHLGRRGCEECFEGTLKFMLGGTSPMQINGEDFDILIYMEMIATKSWRDCYSPIEEF